MGVKVTGLNFSDGSSMLFHAGTDEESIVEAFGYRIVMVDQELRSVTPIDGEEAPQIVAMLTDLSYDLEEVKQPASEVIVVEEDGSRKTCSGKCCISTKPYACCDCGDGWFCN